MSINATEATGASAVTGLYVPGGASAAGAEATSGDKQMFLELLVAQLRYQDPLKPTDSAQFLAQTAQFNALEKMQDVADQTASLLAAQVSFGAAGLVGKDVTYLDADGVEQTGQVAGVRFGPEGPVLDVGGSQVALSAVQTVGGTVAGTATGTSSTGSATPSTDDAAGAAGPSTSASA